MKASVLYCGLAMIALGVGAAAAVGYDWAHERYQQSAGDTTAQPCSQKGLNPPIYPCIGQTWLCQGECIRLKDGRSKWRRVIPSEAAATGLYFQCQMRYYDNPVCRGNPSWSEGGGHVRTCREVPGQYYWW